MTSYIALLRAVNLGGVGRLPMAKLLAMAEGLGFANVRTYIASGNLLFDSDHGETQVKAALETRLAAYAGRPLPVLIRTAAELAAVRAADPFPDAHGSRHLVYFLDAAPPADTINHVRDQAGERIALGLREIYVDYGAGIRHTKLKMNATKSGTARNMNTVAKLTQLVLS